MPIIESPNHTVWLMERGGQRRIAQIVDLERVVYRRFRDDIGTAQVNVRGEVDSAQADTLRLLLRATGRLEIVIYRMDERVFEGPITLVTFHRDGVVIEAKDVLFYAARTIMRAGYDNSYPNVDYVTNRAYQILTAELARKEVLDPPINVVPYIVNHHTAADAKTSAKTEPYQFTVFEHIDSLAADRGMDYTVVGRAIHLWDTHEKAMGQTQTVTEADFLGEMYVSVYALELGTISAVTDGQGTFGVVDSAGNVGPANIQPDPFYGEWERLETAYDENETAAPTQAELESQAQRNLAGRNPTPLIVRIPDNSSLNMDGVLSMKDLIPGIFIPMRTTLNFLTISQMQKLQNVVVTENDEGETVTITMYPAPGETAAS